MKRNIRYVLFAVVGIILSLLFFTVTIPLLLLLSLFHFFKNIRKKAQVKYEHGKMIIEGKGEFV